jgi:serine O-acetyltransferase
VDFPNMPMESTPQLANHLELPSIVDELRAVRERSLLARRREAPPKLPSRNTLRDAVESLATALYPHRLGNGDITHEGIDFYVGTALDNALRLLTSQIVQEIHFREEQEHQRPIDRQMIQRNAVERVRMFAHTLPRIREYLDSDLQAAFEGDPAAHSQDEVLVCYPGILATMHYRLAHEIHRLGLPLIARIISEIAHSLTGIDIHPGAKIGKHFFIDHGTGVVIGETAVIGERVRLYQAVTLGAKRFPTDENGILLKGKERHPILEDDVVVYAGATILGRITIGRGSIIGGNVWVTRSVPPHSNVTQATPRQELFDHGSGI